MSIVFSQTQPLMKKNLIPLLSFLLLTACAPHPGAGIWGAQEGNSMGIEKVTLSFDGKGEFVSQEQQSVTWHCFWGATGKQTVAMQCTPSINPDIERKFTLVIGENGNATLSDAKQVIGRFERLSGKPEIK